MKIVHVITRLIVGGAQENTLITCKLLADRGHEVTLITGPAEGPEGALFETTKNAPYKVLVLDDLVRPIRPQTDFRAYIKLKALLKELAPDIVHTHSAKGGIIGRYAGHAIKGISGYSRLPGIVHTIHGLAFHPYQHWLKNKLYISIEKAAAEKTDAFISVADAMTSQALAAGIGRPDQYTTAYSAIDETNFLKLRSAEEIAAFRRKFDIPDDALVFVTVARLFELKGHDFIIESAKILAKKHKHVIWLFVGDGVLTRHYKQVIESAGLTHRFRFTGLIPPADIPLGIQASNILLHCSLREGLARAIPQGMLCGKPVISFNTDGSSEVVNNSTGRLVEPKDISGLVTACSELIENEQLRKNLGENAQAYVKQKFAPETMVDTIEKVYGKLL